MKNLLKTSCLIVDDEPIARQIIKNYIAQIAFLENAGECKNAMEALETITNNDSINIIFLDINMPNLNGLAMAKIIKKDIKIIFTTAYSDYAVESYEVNAIDYLLKPFSFERFATAVFKAFKSKEDLVISSEKNVNQHDLEKTIYLKSEGLNYPILVKDIQYCEAMKNYTKVFLNNGKQLKTLVSFSKMEEDLISENSVFIRIHRSFIISKNYITAIKTNNVVLGKTEIPIGLQYRESFLNTIGMKKST